MHHLQAIVYDAKLKTLSILDQLLLPHQVVYLKIKNAEDAWNAIATMQVRGAPAIAIVGLLSVAIELHENISVLSDKQAIVEFLLKKCDYLCTSRPTAVNIRKESDALLAAAQELLADSGVTAQDALAKLITRIELILELDLAVNISLGDYGAQHLLATSKSDKLNVLTHCNTGSLATSGYGTALGVMRSLHKLNKLDNAYCTETRPYNQGARLTAFELLQENMNGTLICDNMVAALMQRKGVDAVIVGADRVVANGDTANKIGTYQIAVLAKYHGVAFYVASPLSTIDMSLATGDLIPIEERPHKEMKYVAGTLIAPEEINCWNPAFDVTPASLITGIITEKGVFPPGELKAIKELQ